MSRITSGSAKNTKLLVASGITRPITDRIKISLFDTLTPVLKDSYCLDLYAGSGAIGLEALSRGAKHTTFVENDPEASSLISKNSIRAQLSHKVDIHQTTVEDYLENTTFDFDLIFLDPPFPQAREDKYKILLACIELMKDESYIVYRYPKGEIYPEELMKNKKTAQEVWKKKYGLSVISIFHRNN